MASPKSIDVTSPESMNIENQYKHGLREAIKELKQTKESLLVYYQHGFMNMKPADHVNLEMRIEDINITIFKYSERITKSLG